jgi:cystathionine beta-lyase/cystathionine gamma-synthase
MFSLVLEGGKVAAFDFLRHIAIGRNAVSLGGVETSASIRTRQRTPGSRRKSLQPQHVGRPGAYLGRH